MLCVPQAVVPSLTGVLQGLMMNPVVGVVCPEMQESVLQVFMNVDPPNSRVCTYIIHTCCQGTGLSSTYGDSCQINSRAMLFTRPIPSLWKVFEEGTISV